MNQPFKEEIAQALYKKDIKVCPRCGDGKFEIVGQTMVPLNDDIKVLKIGGPSIPCAIIACSNCGFITLHALSMLDLSASVENGQS